MESIKPVRLEIRYRPFGKPTIVATFSDGHEISMGDPKTRRGAIMCLVRYANQFGFRVEGHVAIPAIRN